MERGSADSPRATEPRVPRKGDRLAGRYHLGTRLGRGGLGDVFEAEDEALGIRVALKLVRLHGRDRDWEVRRLKREVLLARSVSHPNVATVYDVGRHGEADAEQWFLTME